MPLPRSDKMEEDSMYGLGFGVQGISFKNLRA